MKKKRILVTGGAGFIGTEIVKQLIRLGYQVRVADDLSKKNGQFSQDSEIFKVDLTQKRAAMKVMEGMDYCIHLAAKIGGIGYFHKYPALILNENNKIYSAVFESAIENKIKRLIYISSSMVYESSKSFPGKEKDVKRIPPPISAYGFSKLIGEWYCKAFKDQFGLEYTIVRPFNAYGVNESPQEEIGYAHVIPDLIRKILSGQYPLEILGNGKQTRCFTHVSDIAKGIIMALQSEKAKNEDFNLGSEEEVRISDLARKIFKVIYPHKTFKKKLVSGFRYDIQRRIPSITKARTILRWKPVKKLDDELPIIINWIKNLRP